MPHINVSINNRIKKRQALRQLSPHVGLALLLFVYISLGSLVFLLLETSREEEDINQEILELRKLYDHVKNRSTEVCENNKNNETEFKHQMQSLLVQISKKHHQFMRPINQDDLNRTRGDGWTTRWTYPASVLYTLGVLTTTGYSYVLLLTPLGQLFAIVYGLIGFPIMFITAADIGKFMSETVTFFHSTYVQKCRMAARARTLTRSIAAFRFSSRNFRREQLHALQARDSCISSNSNYTERTSENDEDSIELLELPTWAIFGLLLSFCCLGGLMYGKVVQEWGFITSLYFAFNAVTNVTLGDIPSRGILFSVLTVIYVIFGLAVVTMSIDLAQNQLRNLFRRIHYFGRTIKESWQEYRSRLVLDDDVKEVLLIIAAIRNRHPQKRNITKRDILRFLKEEKRGSRDGVSRMGTGGSGAGTNVIMSSRLGRRYLAFIPDGIGGFKFADDIASACCDSSLASLDSDEFIREEQQMPQTSNQKLSKQLVVFGNEVSTNEN